jgi:hypothetical protein
MKIPQPIRKYLSPLKRLAMMKHRPLALLPYYSGARRGSKCDDRVRLNEAMSWLRRAENTCNGKGVSIKFSLFSGWDPLPYPETTGYILETFLEYAALSGDLTYRNSALALGDWEISIQHRSGGVLSSIANPEVLRVFNTGQVIHGWCTLFDATGEKRYLDAAVRACDYLSRGQEKDGGWVQDTFCGARTYHARVDWAILRVARLSGRKEYAEMALRNLRWVASQQISNGWFANCGFHAEDPITHVIAYTIRGILESAEEIKVQGLAFETDLFRQAQTALESVEKAVRASPLRGVPGLARTAYAADWSSENPHACLTGNVQLALCYMRFDKIQGTRKFQAIADLLIDAVASLQVIRTSETGIRGAIPGSYPYDLGYHPFEFPNWATKFFADAVLMRLAGNTRS